MVSAMSSIIIGARPRDVVVIKILVAVSCRFRERLELQF